MSFTLGTLALASYVLVPSGAVLQARPQADAAELHLGFGWNAVKVGRRVDSKEHSVDEPAANDDIPAPAAVMELVERRGDYVAVRAVPWSALGQHCARMLPELAELEVVTYVRAKDLTAVVTRDIRVDLPDGSSIALKAGVPVASGQGEHRWVDARGVVLSLAIPKTAIGFEYEPTEKFAGPTAVGFQIPIDSPLRIAEQTVLDLSGAFTLTGHAAALLDVRRAGSEFWGTVQNPCLSVRGRADAGAVLRFQSHDGQWVWADGRPVEPESESLTSSGRPPAEGGYATSWQVKPPDPWGSFGRDASVEVGSDVRILGGSTGQVHTQFHTSQETETVGQQICVRPAVSARQSDRLRICFDADAVQIRGSVGLGTVGHLGAEGMNRGGTEGINRQAAEGAESF